MLFKARSVSDPSVLCLHDERIKASPVAAKQAWSVMKLAMQCVDAGARRPTMSMVVQELKQIVQCPVISNVALGSHLFKRNA